MGYVLQGYDDRVIAGVAGRIDCQVGIGVDDVLLNVDIGSQEDRSFPKVSMAMLYLM